MDIIKNPAKSTWKKLLSRSSEPSASLDALVKEVFEKIKSEGDKALTAFSEHFDGASLTNFRVCKTALACAGESVPQPLKDAINKAKDNIHAFHYAQRTNPIEIETMPGVVCRQEKRPISKVGLYIPGGTAPLFSTVLMLAVPAQIAGCKEIVLCSPPDKHGHIAPEILYAAHLCGVTAVFKVGGIQAIAAMCLGTETIPSVYKIFGPGNKYVTAAKQFARHFGVEIDLPAGPSELMIIADDGANPEFTAIDLLSQAEHGADSQVILIANDTAFLEKTIGHLQTFLEELPRKALAQAALEHSRFIFSDSKEATLELLNEYAPEHLILCTKDNDFYVRGIENAGSVFLGRYTPESAGDYASGTNHTLPTSGYAKSCSGVNLDSFMKAITFQEISNEGLLAIGPIIEKMAEAEQLHAHKNAVTLRLNQLKNKND